MAKIKKNKDLDKTELEIFSSGVKNFLKRSGVRSEEIAKKIGVSASSVCSWKYGKTFPDVPNFLKLVGCGLSPFEIMEKKLELVARINDNEYLIDKNVKEIDFVKKSSMSGAMANDYVQHLCEVNFELREIIEDLKNRLEKMKS